VIRNTQTPFDIVAQVMSIVVNMDVIWVEIEGRKYKYAYL
jgi:hypothetical protein